MAKFVKGDVVVIPFPFSDLSGSKRRPALVLADLPGDDIILCQITSQQNLDNFAIPLIHSDFVSGNLPIISYIRPTRIFTADKNMIIRISGSVDKSVSSKVAHLLSNLFK
ncbi:type II toxin-antitoxin system PemK/MazF family toxin [Mucilaginibacter glaciei]|uniref:Type II toxin-antitoxin system PemK/MazF family toxin n=1 Tax=Mucilaginibacter glaciei TaxID=2772109 RepID=A0A926NTS9_9SPHI|nr:type II toxin-antitoxin system PemK/MazF family toxin [Mucilaginibacter glaciei]MBD1394462.1 type II toxin-antitoxin system PemK/MazF family toxin [Mucilaginibacter glaciei]